LEPYFSQMAPPLSTQMSILRSVFGSVANGRDVIW
jgi:hypothetical protein